MSPSQTRRAAAPDISRAKPLGSEELRSIHAYWRAANYLSVGQIYLLDNPLLARPLRLEDIKPRLLGPWGTTRGLTLIYAHASRPIKARGFRQPESHSLLHRRRRRGGDRSIGGKLALEQVPQSLARRSSAADPPPQRLQDRQPDRAGADPRERAAPADGGLWAHACVRQRRRPDEGAPADGCRAGLGAGRDRAHQGLESSGRPALMAHDRPPDA